MRHIELTAIVAMLYACVTGGAYILVKVLLAVEMRVPQKTQLYSRFGIYG